MTRVTIRNSITDAIKRTRPWDSNHDLAKLVELCVTTVYEPRRYYLVTRLKESIWKELIHGPISDGFPAFYSHNTKFLLSCDIKVSDLELLMGYYSTNNGQLYLIDAYNERVHITRQPSARLRYASPRYDSLVGRKLKIKTLLSRLLRDTTEGLKLHKRIW